MFHYAIQTPRVHVAAYARLLTIFTVFLFFGPPHGLLPTLFSSPAKYTRCLQYTLPISTEAALNTSPSYTHSGPF